MPRSFILSGPNFSPIVITLKKFTREEIYGIREKIPLSSTGHELSTITISTDGIHKLPSGAISHQYWDVENNYVASSEIVETSIDGQPLPLTPSIFETGIILKDTIPLADYLRYDITASYILESNDSLDALFSEVERKFTTKRLFRFKYAYYPTAHPGDAFLLPFQNQILLMVGYFSSPVWVSLGMNLEEIFGNFQEEEEFLFEEYW